MEVFCSSLLSLRFPSLFVVCCSSPLYSSLLHSTTIACNPTLSLVSCLSPSTTTMKYGFVLVLVVLGSLFLAVNGVAAPSVVIERSLRDAGGRLQFLVGELGLVHDELEYVHSLHTLLELQGTERFEFRRREIDMRGNVHVHFQQFIRGIEVDGGELAVHYEPSTRRVFALSISVLADDPKASYNQRIHRALLDKSGAELVRESAPPVPAFEILGKPEKVFLLHEGHGHAAVRALVSYSRHDQVQLKSHLYTSLHTGQHIVEFPLFFPALNRTIYNTNQTDELPSLVVRTEGQGYTSDAAVNDAYDNAGVCYNFYKTKFNRDSYDGNGAAMISTVHYEVDYNNAFWNGEQVLASVMLSLPLPLPLPRKSMEESWGWVGFGLDFASIFMLLLLLVLLMMAIISKPFYLLLL